MRPIFFFFFLFVFGAQAAVAQVKENVPSSAIAREKKKEVLRLQLEKAGIIYPIENNFGLRIASNGFGAYYEHLKFKTVDRKSFFTTDFFYFIDFKEKQTTTYPFPGDNLQNSYHYGKINDLFGFRAAYGYRKAITDKTESDEVQVSYTLAGGLTLGLLKPYFLDISYGLRVYDPRLNLYYYEETKVVSEGFSPTNAAIFLTPQVVNIGGENFAYIKGPSSFGESFSSMQLVPGLHGRVAFNFDWGPRDEIVKQMEVGLMIDLYNKALPLYYNNFNSQFNFSVYFSMGIGKRRASNPTAEKTPYSN